VQVLTEESLPAVKVDTMVNRASAINTVAKANAKVYLRNQENERRKQEKVSKHMLDADDMADFAMGALAMSEEDASMMDEEEAETDGTDGEKVRHGESAADMKRRYREEKHEKKMAKEAKADEKRERASAKRELRQAKECLSWCYIEPESEDPDVDLMMQQISNSLRGHLQTFPSMLCSQLSVALLKAQCMFPPISLPAQPVLQVSDEELTDSLDSISDLLGIEQSHESVEIIPELVQISEVCLKAWRLQLIRQVHNKWHQDLGITSRVTASTAPGWSMMPLNAGPDQPCIVLLNTWRGWEIILSNEEGSVAERLGQVITSLLSATSVAHIAETMHTRPKQEFHAQLLHHMDNQSKRKAEFVSWGQLNLPRQQSLPVIADPNTKVGGGKQNLAEELMSRVALQLTSSWVAVLRGASGQASLEEFPELVTHMVLWALSQTYTTATGPQVPSWCHMPTAEFSTAMTIIERLYSAHLSSTVLALLQEDALPTRRDSCKVAQLLVDCTQLDHDVAQALSAVAALEEASDAPAYLNDRFKETAASDGTAPSVQLGQFVGRVAKASARAVLRVDPQMAACSCVAQDSSVLVAPDGLVGQRGHAVSDPVSISTLFSGGLCGVARHSETELQNHVSSLSDNTQI